MKHWIIILLFVLVFVIMGCIEKEYQMLSTIGTLKAGTALIEITPDIEKYTDLSFMGYFPPVRIEDVHDPVYVRTLALSNGNRLLVICVLDMCFIDQWFKEAVIAQVSDILNDESLLLCATHTHSSVGNITHQPLLQFMFGEQRETIFNGLMEKTAQSIRIAMDSLVEAKLGMAFGNLDDLNRNRRAGGDDPQFQDFGTDAELTVLKITNSSNQPIAILSNYGAHPTIAPVHSDPKISAEWCGYYNRYIEEYFGGAAYEDGGSVLSLFVNGIQGDVAPNIEASGLTAWEKIDYYGNQLKNQAIPIIHSIEEQNLKDTIRLGSYSYTIPSYNIIPATPTMEALMKTIPLENFVLKVHSYVIDQMIVSAIPGEMTTPVGLEIKNTIKQQSGNHSIITTLSNDYVAYIPSETQYEEDATDANYERFVCIFGPKTDQMFIQAALSSAKPLY